jgi:hypothetical protein
MIGAGPDVTTKSLKIGIARHKCHNGSKHFAWKEKLLFVVIYWALLAALAPTQK